jgi:hypothetical protein
MRYLLSFTLAIASFAIGTQLASADFLRDLITPQIVQQLHIGAAADKVQKNLPANIQAMITKVRADLANLPDDQLFVLNYSADVCKSPETLNCNGVPNADVKAFVSAEVDRRKAVDAKLLNERTLYVASGGLMVSFLSLIVSAVGLAKSGGRKKR